MKLKKTILCLSVCASLLALASCGEDGKVGTSSVAPVNTPAPIVSSDVIPAPVSSDNGMMRDASDMMSAVEDWIEGAASRLESGYVGDMASR